MNSILHQLRKVVSEEKTSEILKEGIIKDLGSVINHSSKLEDVVKEANDRLEVLERTGRPHQVNIKPSILLKFANHPSEEVRTFIAKSLPVSMLERYMYDFSPRVRYATAKRISVGKLKEMASYYSSDDELNQIKRNRLVEKKTPLDSDSSHENAGLDIPDIWYDNTALRVVMDYNGNIEGRWDEIYCDRILSSMQQTSRIKIDKKKLYNAIQKVLKRKEQEALRAEEKSVRLSTESRRFTPREIDKTYLLEEILSSRTSSLSRVQLCNDFFSIKESILSPSHKRMSLREGGSHIRNPIIPIKGTLPEGHRFSYEIEKALDLFEESWNRLQEMDGESFRIKWAPDPTSRRNFIFTWEIR